MRNSTRNKKPLDILTIILKQAFLIIPVIIVLGPLFYIVMGAFKTKADYVSNQVGIPKHFVLDNFQALIKDGMIFIDRSSGNLLKEK